MKSYAELVALAAELQNRLPVQKIESMNVRVWADEEDGGIHCAPAVDGILPGCGYILYVEEILLFAKYHDMSISTKTYETGAGLCLD